MTPTPSRSERKLSAVARTIVAATLLLAACLKLVLASPTGHAEVVGLASLLGTLEARIASASVEILLGVGLLSPLRRRFVWPLTMWLTALAGLTIAFVVGGVSPAACGCAGPLPFPPSARVATVFGLCALTYVWVRLGNDGTPVGCNETPSTSVS